MNRSARALVVTLACAPLYTSGWALDLSQAYKAAMAQDASLRVARAATAARSERIPQTRAQMLPNLSASASRNRNALDNTEPFLGTPVSTSRNYNSSSMALTLRQPLFRKYQMADYRQAQAQLEDANGILEREIQNVGVRVSGAYFEALLTGDQLALAMAQKIAYTSKLDAAKKRFAAGAGTRTDVDEAQAAVDLNAAHELEARQSVDFTRRKLQTLVNHPIDFLATLDASKLVLVPPVPNRLEDWIERAEAGSPEIRSLKAQIDAARLEVDKAEAGHYPTLDAVAQVSHNERDTVTSVNTRYTSKSIGLQLNVPLFSGGYVNATVRQALADQERAEQALEALRRDLGVRVHKEFRSVTEGVLYVRALEQAVRSTEQVMLSNRRSFEAGSRTLNDTLNADQQMVSAQGDLAQARYAYLISRVRLQALAGAPPGEVIDEINAWLKP